MREYKDTAEPPAEDDARLGELAARRDALGLSLANRRAEAIKARKASGIEDQWKEDEEFYESIDDANRNDSASSWSYKPPGQKAPTNKQTRSTVFIPLTRAYVDIAAASLCDIALPSDEANFKINPTPVPELVDLSEGKYPRQVLSQADAVAKPGGLMSLVGGKPDEGRRQAFLGEQKEKAKQILEEARAKSDAAQKRIEDWFVETNFNGELRDVVHDGAKVGTGIIKGPHPEKRRHVAFVDGALAIHEEISPASKRVSYWNFWPDANCGENIQNGSYTFECDFLTDKQLSDLKGTPGSIDEQIDLCLVEGPIGQEALENPSPDMKVETDRKGQFQIWYFYGNLKKEDLEAAGCECDEKEQIPAMVTMVNNRVIKAALNPLDSGEFPYDIFRWQKKKGHWAGVGVARQGRTPQRIVNAGARNLMDNAGLASGGLIIFKEGIVAADGGQMRIAPRMVYKAGPDADIDDVRKAFAFIQVPMVQKELLGIVEWGMKLMEDSTSLPMLLQGQLGKAPDTVGGMQLLNNNANTTRRNLGRTLDGDITKPHVKRYYTWLMQYGEDEEKGEYVIEAKGSSALVERDIQNQQIPQIVQASLNPVFGKDPKKAMDMYIRSLKFDPAAFDYDDEEWKQVVENMSQAPQDPRLAVAQLQAQTDEKLKALDGQFKERLTRIDQAWQSAENEKDRQVDLILADFEQKGVDKKLINDARAKLADGKFKLADTTIKLRGQQAMAAADRDHDARQTVTPPTEPRGRAETGKAFQQ